MIVRLLPKIVVVGLLASGCAPSDDDGSSSTAGAAAGPQAGAGGVVGSPDAMQADTCTYDTEWTTIEDAFQNDDGYYSYPLSMDVGPTGDLFVLGRADDPTNPGDNTVLRKLAYGGNGFSTLDSYNYASANHTLPGGIGVSPNNQPFYASEEYHGGSGGKSRGMVRGLNSDGDFEDLTSQYYLDTDFHTYFEGTTVTNSGRIVVVGYAYNSSGTHNVVRYSDDGGSTWTTKNPQFSDSASYTRFFNVDKGQGDDIWATGQSYDFNSSCTTKSFATIAKSTDGGANWTFYDNYCITGETVYSIGNVLEDDRGNIMYNSYYYDTDCSCTIWSIRRSTDGGSSFSTVYTWAADEDRTAYSYGMVQGGDGKLYTSGYGINSDTHYVATLHVSNDNGATWSNSESDRINSSTVNIAYDLIVDPNNHTMYQAVYSGAAWTVRKKNCQ